MSRVGNYFLICLLAAVLFPPNRLSAQEPDSAALLRRLAELEAQVAELRKNAAPAPDSTPLKLDGTIEFANDLLVPPSPAPFEELLDVGSAPFDSVVDLRRLVERQNQELQRQGALIEQLRSKAVSFDMASYAAPTGGGFSTVPASVFGPDAASATGSWVNDGLTFVSKDGNFKTHLGGVSQLDVIGFGPLNNITSIPSGAGTSNATNFRRLRLRAEGMMYQNIDWVAEADYAFSLQNIDQLGGALPVTGLRSFPAGVGVQGGNTINVIQPTTVFMTFKDVPWLGNVRIGNQQSWFSFEHIESARFLDFMERAPIMDAFSGANNNGYTPGISIFNNSENMMTGLQLGIYKNNTYDSGFTYDIGNAWTYGGRWIASPFYDEESKGRYMMHIGVGSEYRTFNQNVGAAQGYDNIRIRSRGDLRNASSTLDPNYADTGNFYAAGQTLVNPEVAVQLGSLIIQAEYVASFINGARPAKNIPVSLGDVFMHGGYVEGLYFLTGENRNYNRQTGVFGRVIPKENANWKECTYGAWQAGIRFDWLNLNSGSLINGGSNENLTLGLNWFLNPNARFQFNYVFSWVNNAPPTTYPGSIGSLNGSRFVGDGVINSFGGRLDFNF